MQVLEHGSVAPPGGNGDQPVRAASTVQDVPHRRPDDVASDVTVSSVVESVLNWSITAEMDMPPSYWSRNRDEWLVDWIKRFGNDMLAGAHSKLVAKVAATGWYVEGPLSLAMFYRDMLLNKIGWGAGWQHESSKWMDAFLSRDFGGGLERFRSSAGDRSGPALGFAHLDESKCYPTGVPEWPVIYYNEVRGPIPLHRSQVILAVDMPEPRDIYRGVGFCSVSRTLATSAIMQMLVKYKQQALSDLPPAALLFLSNMTRTQWEDVQDRYDARQYNKGNTVWRDLMVAFGLDPAYPVTAELMEFAKLWEHFDDRTAHDLAIFSFALGYRVDAREYWPVSSGQLGTATETEIMDRKAKASGEGVMFHKMEHGLNSPESLPESCTFRFDYRDDEEDMRAAEIRSIHIQNVRRLWEASPNRVTAGATLPPGEEGGSQAGNDLGPQLDEQDAEERLGIIDTDEARKLLIYWNVIPPEVLGEVLEVDRLYDVRSVERYGPVVRAHRDGRVIVMKRQMTTGEAKAWRTYFSGSSRQEGYTPAYRHFAVQSRRG